MLLGEMESRMMLKVWGRETGKTARNRFICQNLLKKTMAQEGLFYQRRWW
jgi:hypothetical protein